MTHGKPSRCAKHVPRSQSKDQSHFIHVPSTNSIFQTIKSFRYKGGHIACYLVSRETSSSIGVFLIHIYWASNTSRHILWTSWRWSLIYPFQSIYENKKWRVDDWWLTSALRFTLQQFFAANLSFVLNMVREITKSMRQRIFFDSYFYNRLFQSWYPAVTRLLYFQMNYGHTQRVLRRTICWRILLRFHYRRAFPLTVAYLMSSSACQCHCSLPWRAKKFFGGIAAYTFCVVPMVKYSLHFFVDCGFRILHQLQNVLSIFVQRSPLFRQSYSTMTPNQ